MGWGANDMGCGDRLRFHRPAHWDNLIEHPPKEPARLMNIGEPSARRQGLLWLAPQHLLWAWLKALRALRGFDGCGVFKVSR